MPIESVPNQCIPRASHTETESIGAYPIAKTYMIPKMAVMSFADIIPHLSNLDYL